MYISNRGGRGSSEQHEPNTEPYRTPTKNATKGDMTAEYNEPHWTTDLPAEDGFYWYREGGLPVEVVEWRHEKEEFSVTSVPGWSTLVKGEFWSARLEVPE